MKISYPATFEVDKEDENYINVAFPDIWGAVTFGKGMEDARYMAQDLLKTMAEYTKDFPSTSLEQTKANFPNRHVEMIEVEV